MKLNDFIPQDLFDLKDWDKLKPFLSEQLVQDRTFDDGVVEFYIGLDSGPYIRVRYPAWSKEVKLYFLEALEEELFDVFCALLIPELQFPYPEPYLLCLTLCLRSFIDIWHEYGGYRIVFDQVLTITHSQS